MDNVALWDRVLSDDEIADIYRAMRPLGDLCRLP
jgi:hypothetical protein